MLGIDVSKKTLVCSISSSLTLKRVWGKSYPNTSEGIGQLLAEVSPETPWVIEPTGSYSTPVAKIGRQHGRDVRMAPPNDANAFLKSLPARAKTDKLDSKGLSLFGQSRVLGQYPLKEDHVEKIDHLIATRKSISKEASKLKQQLSELKHGAPYLEAVIGSMLEQIVILDKDIKSLCKSTPSFEAAARLLKVPGIGPVTSAAVTSRLSAKSFAHPDAFVAYCGLDLRVQDSGDKESRRRLSKRGDAELRRLLYLAAQSNLRCTSSPFKDQYHRELKKGLSSTGAIVAVARKLAKVCWSLHKHGGEYDVNRVNVQPKSVNTEEFSTNSAEGLDNEP